MKEIPLTQGHVALVDDADHAAVSAFNWSIARRKHLIYAQRAIKKNGKKSVQLLHKFLLPDAIEVNHKNGDGRDNQRHNLQPVSHGQNQQSFQRKRAGSSSVYRGVAWDKKNLKWRAQIHLNAKGISLGRFDTEVAAARAYDLAAIKHFGEFANPNFTI